MHRTVTAETPGYAHICCSVFSEIEIIMKYQTIKATLVAVALSACGAANADFGVGVKAGTLGLGLEGRWSPIPWLDMRVGANRYDYDITGAQAGINYDATLALDTLYLTGNFHFPLSPFRITVGAFSNGNELQMRSQNTDGTGFNIGGEFYSSSDVGTLTSVTSFAGTAPYLGVGFDFEIFGKAGLNLDFGVLWQGSPIVSLQADGLAANVPAFQDAMELERLELENTVSDYKAWPVISLGLIFNF